MAWLTHIVFWHWWVLAGVMLLLEMWAPTYFFLWVAIAAAAVGFLVLVFPVMALETQLIAFGALVLVAVVGWYRFREADS